MVKRKASGGGGGVTKALKAVAKSGRVVPYQETLVTVNQPKAPSVNVVSTEYDVWSDIPLKTDTLDTVYIEYKPTDTGTNPVIITVPAADENMPDISKSYFIFDVYATDLAGDALAGDKAFFKNNAFHNIIKQVEVKVDQAIVGVNTESYMQEAYITTLLNHNKEAQDTFMSVQSWCKDVSAHMNSAVAAENTALAKRGLLQTKQQHLLFGFPVCDLAKADRVLPPNTKLEFKIYLNDPKMIFTALDTGDTDRAKLVFGTPTLMLARKIPTPELWESLQKRWMSHPWTVPLPHTKLRTKTLSVNTPFFQFDDLFNGEIPNMLCVWMVPVLNVAGSYKLNQYDYQRHDLRSFELLLNGNDLIKYAKNLHGKHLRHAYLNMKLQDGSGFVDKNGPYITESEFGAGYFVLQFDLTRGKTGHMHISQLPRTGNLSIKMTFGGNLTAAVQLYYMGTFNRILEIDHDHNGTYPM